MESQETQKFSAMQQVKRHLFAMRNGIVADTLRKGGSPFKVIFGVNLPQLVEIAQTTGKNPELGRQLWANDTTRESMLLAPMLMEADTFSKEEALEWIAKIPTIEVADILTHRLLRHEPYALQLAQTLASDDDFMRRYTGLRLMCHLGNAYPEAAHAIGTAEAARGDQRTHLLAIRLQEYYEN